MVSLFNSWLRIRGKHQNLVLVLPLAVQVVHLVDHLGFHYCISGSITGAGMLDGFDKMCTLCMDHYTRIMVMHAS